MYGQALALKLLRFWLMKRRLGGIGVVISGPPSFYDDAKAAVIAQARVSKTTQFELEVEACSW